MSNTKPVSFRIPSKYIVFLDHLAADSKSDRTKILIRMLEAYLTSYLNQKAQQPTRYPVTSASRERL